MSCLPKLLEKTYKRLERVQIECLPYGDILRRYDRPETLFYLDPPYWGRKLYRVNFTESDFVVLEKNLRSVKGKFVLSLNDVPEVRKLFLSGVNSQAGRRLFNPSANKCLERFGP